jgi:hypothetical protein
MLQDHQTEREKVVAWATQGMRPRSDVGKAARQMQERRRTIVALVSASIISLVVWALVIALKLQ